MTRFKRGDVVLVFFPNSDLTTYKKRPALVVQADGLETGLVQVIVALITSNMTRRGHRSRVALLSNSAEFLGTGLQTDSVIVTDNLATVKLSFVYKRLGSLSTLRLIDAALAHTFGLTLR